MPDAVQSSSKKRKAAGAGTSSANPQARKKSKTGLDANANRRAPFSGSADTSLPSPPPRQFLRPKLSTSTSTSVSQTSRRPPQRNASPGPSTRPAADLRRTRSSANLCSSKKRAISTDLEDDDTPPPASSMAKLLLNASRPTKKGTVPDKPLVSAKKTKASKAPPKRRKTTSVPIDVIEIFSSSEEERPIRRRRHSTQITPRSKAPIPPSSEIINLCSDSDDEPPPAKAKMPVSVVTVNRSVDPISRPKPKPKPKPKPNLISPSRPRGSKDRVPSTFPVTKPPKSTSVSISPSPPSTRLRKRRLSVVGNTRGDTEQGAIALSKSQTPLFLAPASTSAPPMDDVPAPPSTSAITIPSSPTQPSNKHGSPPSMELALSPPPDPFRTEDFVPPLSIDISEDLTLSELIPDEQDTALQDAIEQSLELHENQMKGGEDVPQSFISYEAVTGSANSPTQKAIEKGESDFSVVPSATPCQPPKETTTLPTDAHSPPALSPPPLQTSTPLFLPSPDSEDEDAHAGKDNKSIHREPGNKSPIAAAPSSSWLLSESPSSSRDSSVLRGTVTWTGISFPSEAPPLTSELENRDLDGSRSAAATALMQVVGAGPEDASLVQGDEVVNIPSVERAETSLIPDHADIRGLADSRTMAEKIFEEKDVDRPEEGRTLLQEAPSVDVSMDMDVAKNEIPASESTPRPPPTPPPESSAPQEMCSENLDVRMQDGLDISLMNDPQEEEEEEEDNIYTSTIPLPTTSIPNPVSTEHSPPASLTEDRSPTSPSLPNSHTLNTPPDSSIPTPTLTLQAVLAQCLAGPINTTYARSALSSLPTKRPLPALTRITYSDPPKATRRFLTPGFFARSFLATRRRGAAFGGFGADGAGGVGGEAVRDEVVRDEVRMEAKEPRDVQDSNVPPPEDRAKAYDGMVAGKPERVMSEPRPVSQHFPPAFETAEAMRSPYHPRDAQSSPPHTTPLSTRSPPQVKEIMTAEALRNDPCLAVALQESNMFMEVLKSIQDAPRQTTATNRDQHSGEEDDEARPSPSVVHSTRTSPDPPRIVQENHANDRLSSSSESSLDTLEDSPLPSTPPPSIQDLHPEPASRDTTSVLFIRSTSPSDFTSDRDVLDNILRALPLPESSKEFVAVTEDDDDDEFLLSHCFDYPDLVQ